MQTFKNTDDVTINKFPPTPQEWAKNPTIEFTVAKDRIVHEGDRIFCARKQQTIGPNSGDIVEIYYYIDTIVDHRPSMVHPSMLTVITAKAIRREL